MSVIETELVPFRMGVIEVVEREYGNREAAARRERQLEEAGERRLPGALRAADADQERTAFGRALVQPSGERPVTARDCFSESFRQPLAIDESFDFFRCRRRARPSQVGHLPMRDAVRELLRDLLEYAPVARRHVDTGWLTVEALCRASVTISDSQGDLIEIPHGYLGAFTDDPADSRATASRRKSAFQTAQVMEAGERTALSLRTEG